MIRIFTSRHPRLFLVVVPFLLVAAASTAAQTPRPFVQDALLNLELEIGGPARATLSPTTGLVTFLAFGPYQQPLVNLAGSAPAEERAQAFLEEHGRAFGIIGRDSVALAHVAGPDEASMEHVRFRQTHLGVPIAGGELTVHLRDSVVVAVNAKTLADLDHLETIPAVDPLEAEVAARFFLDRRLEVTEAELSEPRLELFNRGLLEGRRGWTRLAWFFEASAPGLREYIWVDAVSGALLLHFSQLTDAKYREVYDANDPTDSSYGNSGSLVRSEGGPPTGDTEVAAAYDYSGDTYDYFWNNHGRDSFDGAGAALYSVVHFCPSALSCPWGNASWDGTAMWYGEGYAQADDVAAHELTHAVTEYTANLFYYMQSGALNESYSDIFGETVDLLNAAGDDTPTVRWVIGEDLPIGPIRNLMDPTGYGDPGKMSDAQFVCGDSNSLVGFANDDNGGVHFNSGVPNHAYALMVDGGSYNGETVTGIDLTKAGKIQYRALAHYLLSASDFLDNYNALKQACLDLVGIAGITQADCTEVGDALDAVEMSATWPCTPTQATAPALCPPGQAPDVWHYQDVESSTLSDCPTNATLPLFWCKSGPTSTLGAFATSGVHSYYGYDKPGDPPGIAGGIIFGGYNTFTGPVPAGARMQFNHSYGFENDGTSYWDGGRVEYSTDAWITDADGGPLIVAGAAYSGPLSTFSPWAGGNAFVADSWGYTATQLDLSSLAGAAELRYRFAVAYDSLVDDYGWWVDDIRIYGCAECLTNRILDASYNGLAAVYKAEASMEAGSGFTVGTLESVTLEAPEVRLSNDLVVNGELTVNNVVCTP